MRYFILCIFILFCTESWGQSYKFGLQSGLGFYAMNDLNGINELVSENLPFNTKQVSNFPPYFYYRPTLLMNYGIYTFGLVYTFQSTGSRVSGKDYSGEYRYDMKVNSNCPGIYNEIKLISPGKFQFSFYTAFGYSFSKLTINRYLFAVDTTITNDNYKFKSLNYYIEPGFTIAYPVNNLGIALNIGYFLQFGNEAFYTNNNKALKLIDSRNGKFIRPDWNGLRVGFSLYYILDNTVHNK